MANRTWLKERYNASPLYVLEYAHKVVTYVVSFINTNLLKKFRKPLIILGMSSVIIYRKSQGRRLERVK